MTRYTAAQARQRVAELLDAAERGPAVVIERRGTRFRVQAEGHRRRPAGRRRSILAYLDPVVESGHWTWTWGSKGVTLVPRRRAR